MAPPTRLTEPARTSPIAKMPGTLVSSGLLAPVFTKPFASSSTPQSVSHSVLGSAPRNRNTLRIGRVPSRPESRERQVTDSRPESCEPVMSTISVPVSNSIFGIDEMRSMRYFDMLAASPEPRTSIQTFVADPDRNTAPCPAEFPPPTTTTSAPMHALASIGDAQYHTPRPSMSLSPRQLG